MFGSVTGAAQAPGAASPFSPFGASTAGASGGMASSTPFGVANAGAGMATNGTRGVPYVPTLLPDGAGSSSTPGATATNVAFHVITAQPAYAAKSTEELRWEDLQQGVRGGSGNVSNVPQLASSQPGGGGTTSPGASGFGAFGGANTGGGFGTASGASTAFGATPGQSPFGAAPGAAASPFGAAGGAFGQMGAKPAFGATGAFGAPTAATNQPFGAPAASPFGAPAGGATNTPFGAPKPAGTTAFGAPGGTGLFGQQQASPFGTAPTTGAAPGGGLFGGQQQSGGAPAFGAFGQTQTQQAPGLFGGGATGTAPGQGLFGQQQPAASNPFGGGAQAGAAPGGGLFGQTAPGGNLFGNATASQPFGQQQTTGAFGGMQPSQPGGLFGGGSPSGSAFGATTAPGSSPFGAQPAAGAQPFGMSGGLFGNTTPGSTGAFGQQQSAQAAAPLSGFGGGSNLFGGTQPAAGGGLFGSGMAGSQPGGMFGGAGTTTPLGGATAASPFSLGGGTVPAGGMTWMNPAGTPQNAAFVQTGAGAGQVNPYGLPPARAEYLGMDAAPAPGGQRDGTVSATVAVSRSTLLLAPPPPKALQPPRSAAAVLSARRRAAGPAASLGTQAIGNNGQLPSTMPVGMRLGGGSSPSSLAGLMSPSASGASMARTPSGSADFGIMLTPAGAGGLSPGGPSGADVGAGPLSDGPASSPYADAFQPRDNPRALIVRGDRIAAATADLLLAPGDHDSAGAPAGDAAPAPAADADGDGLFRRGQAAQQAPEPGGSDGLLFPMPSLADGIANRTSNGGTPNGGTHVSPHARAGSGSEGGGGGGGGRPPVQPHYSELSGPSASLVPVLTLPGHFMRPSPQELAQRSPAELARVSDFTVLRIGVASIRWLVPVDVRGIVLDDIIRFGKRSVAVYPNDEEAVNGGTGAPSALKPLKPPRGQGLNCPAEITYQNIFKVDSTTGVPTRSPAAIAAFKHKLRRVLDGQDGAQFVSYDPEEGEWVFRVEHFSKYGLPDEDDDMEEEENAAMDTNAAHDSDDSDGPWGIVLPAAAKGLTPPRQMGASPDEGAAMPAPVVLDKPLLHMPARRQQRQSPTPSAILLAASAPPPPTAPTLPPSYVPLVAPPKNLGTPARDADIVTDAGLALGRSFRCGWAPDGTLYHSGAGGHGTRVGIIRVPGWVYPAPGAVAALAACMRVHRQHSIVSVSDTGAPLWRLTCTPASLGSLCSAYLRALDTSLAAAVEAHPGGPKAGAIQVAAHSQALQLVAKLHAAASAGGATDEVVEAASRRAAVLSWLAQHDVTRAPVAAQQAAFDSANAPVGPALEALASGRAVNAVAALVASGDPRHATLVAQAGGAGPMRRLLSQQLRTHGTAHIAPGRALLLRLLSGDAAAGGCGLTSHWKQALLLQSRLGGGPSQPVEHAMGRYEDSVRAGSAPPPVPGFAHHDRGAASAEDCSYALLKACCSPGGHVVPPAQLDGDQLTTIVRASAYTSCSWDVVPGWHLGSTLMASAASPLPDGPAAVLSAVAFEVAVQLCGCPDTVPWAVYACLTMANDPIRSEATAKAIIARCWPQLASLPGATTFLARRCGVPTDWMAAAAAQWSTYATKRGDAPRWWPAPLADAASPNVTAPVGGGEEYGEHDAALVAAAQALRGGDGGWGGVEAVWALQPGGREQQAGTDVCARLDAMLCVAA